MWHICLCVTGGELEQKKERYELLWFSYLCGGTNSPFSLKTGLFTGRQASELGDYTKPSAEQVSTSKKLRLLKVLLRCLCRLFKGQSDRFDSSGISMCAKGVYVHLILNVSTNHGDKSGST